MRIADLPRDNDVVGPVGDGLALYLAAPESAAGDDGVSEVGDLGNGELEGRSIVVAQDNGVVVAAGETRAAASARSCARCLDASGAERAEVLSGVLVERTLHLAISVKPTAIKTAAG